MPIKPSSYTVDVSNGLLAGASSKYQKKLSDLSGLYHDQKAFEASLKEQGDVIVYEVTDHRPSDASGDLIFGVTRMSPGRIGNEFYLTRGHIHALGNRPEIYRGEAGEGLMLMESPEGETRIVEIRPNTICYVPPFWIHRSVNTGSTDLVMSFCYPSDSGQDYSVIEKTGGMKTRIISDGTGWQAVANTQYRPRSEADIQAIYNTAG